MSAATEKQPDTLQGDPIQAQGQGVTTEPATGTKGPGFVRKVIDRVWNRPAPPQHVQQTPAPVYIVDYDESDVPDNTRRRSPATIMRHLIAISLTMFLVGAIAFAFAFASTVQRIDDNEDIGKNEGPIRVRAAGEEYSYDAPHPSISGLIPPYDESFPPFMEPTTSVTDHLTVTTNVTIPVTVPVTVTQTASLGFNATESVVFGTSATDAVDGTYSATTATTVSVAKSSGTVVRPSSGIVTAAPGHVSSSAPYQWHNSTSTPCTAEVSNGTVYTNVTVTVLPLPFLTTGGTGAVTGSVPVVTGYNSTVSFSVGPTGVSSKHSSKHSRSSVLAGNSTRTQSTMYHTVTSTTTPLDNCTISASETTVPVVSTTAGTDAMTGSTSSTFSSVSKSVSTASVSTPAPYTYSTSTPVETQGSVTTVWRTITGFETASTSEESTVTETTTPTVTVPGTTTVTQGNGLTTVITLTGSTTDTVTVVLSEPSQTFSKTGLSTTQSGFCAPTETETETVVIVLTVTPTSTASSTSTSKHTPKVIASTIYFTESDSESESSTASSTSVETKTSTTTEKPSLSSSSVVTSSALNSTIFSTGGVDGITGSYMSSTITSSSSTEHCNSTQTSTATVTPKLTTSSDNGVDIVVSTYITTYTTGGLFSHSLSDISMTSSAASILYHPFSLNNTGEGTGVPENLPLGPAGPTGVAPSGWNFSFVGPTGTGTGSHNVSSVNATTSAIAPAMTTTSSSSSGVSTKFARASWWTSNEKFVSDPEGGVDLLWCAVMSVVVSLMANW
ncbi:hypothetical protein M426DRAFT_27754 [Hypoxylon sp. CI-4A]|nr:hypothetical protein M426DRAFT_27754 [Hypoxylon sp. CI-4A]